MATVPASSPLDWRPAIRLTSAEYAPLAAIEFAADAEEAAVALAAIASTSASLDRAARTYRALAPESRLSGKGAADAVAPFLFESTNRFSSPEAGAYYAAADLETAAAEVWFHRERELRASGASRAAVDLRELHNGLRLAAADIRGQRSRRPALYDPSPGGNDVSRAFALLLRRRGVRALVYDSLRHVGGECVAVLQPRHVGLPIVEAARVRIEWTARDGRIGLERTAAA